jgi:flagellar basal-body rod protein FlgC
MNYLSTFAISANGMNVEKTRVDVTALNLANMNSTRALDGGPYQPMRVVSGEQINNFDNVFEREETALFGAKVVSIVKLDTPPRLVYEPSHPDADPKGFVHYPGIDHASEMVNLVTALRAYEANLVALNAAKTMAVKALEIGGQ